jgi:hypothetical protein
MAKAPYRHRRHPLTLEEVISFHQGPPGRCSGPASTPEEVVFLEAVGDGLVDRLRKRSAKEADMVLKLIGLLWDVWDTANLLGPDHARKVIRKHVAEWSEKDFSKADEQRRALLLLAEFNGLVKQLGALGQFEKRKTWLLAHNIPKKEAERIAHYPGSPCIEEYLAKRHGLSRSKTHKLLAFAPKVLKERSESH